MPDLQLPYTVLFDIDGTLIDSNDAHARAWSDALHAHHIVTHQMEVRRLIGMGGDKLLRHFGVDPESRRGRDMIERKKEVFGTLLPSLQPTRGARRLLEELRRRGILLAVATSADDEETSALTRQADVADLFPTRASSDDAEESKPDPDIVRAALHKSRTAPSDALLVGDTPYDVEAAQRAGVRSVALRCGGFWSDDALQRAVAIYDDPAALLAALG